jgi:gliding motility-associated-like protein
VSNYPTAPVVTCNPSATATYKYVYKWTAIPGTANYEVSEDGGVTWIANNPVDGTESHGTNSPKFLVRAIGSGLCKTGATSEPIACDLTVYNAISPNGDNKNDVFVITNIEQYPNNTVQIFNRWGKEVFNENGYDNTSKVFTGKNLPDGVYFYIISKGDGTKNLTGTVNISR